MDFSNYSKKFSIPHYENNMCVLSCFSCVQLYVTLWTTAHQAPLSKEFSRQEYWSGLLCPPPGHEIKPTSLTSPALAGRFFTTSNTWEAPTITWGGDYIFSLKANQAKPDTEAKELYSSPKFSSLNLTKFDSWVAGMVTSQRLDRNNYIERCLDTIS